MISERTRSALAAAKARGVQLGSYGKVLSAKNAAAAAERDAALRETLAPMVGLPSRTIAEKLNAPGHEAPRAWWALVARQCVAHDGTAWPANRGLKAREQAPGTLPACHPEIDRGWHGHMPFAPQTS